jgi:hypothetical protein
MAKIRNAKAIKGLTDFFMIKVLIGYEFVMIQNSITKNSLLLPLGVIFGGGWEIRMTTLT